MAQGTPRQIMQAPDSLTGRYLSGKERIPLPLFRRPGNGQKLVVTGARQHN